MLDPHVAATMFDPNRNRWFMAGPLIGALGLEAA